jgi:RNA polymerase sigma factor (sigma-70 family)
MPATEIAHHDDHLVDLFKQGNSDGFGALYKKYFPKVLHTCYSFTGSKEDAFDLAQDIFIKVLTKIETFRGASAFSTWLYSITRNHCLSHALQRKSEIYEDFEQACQVMTEHTETEEFEQRMQMESMEQDIGNCLCLLPPLDQRMLILKYHQNYSIKDLQKEFGLSASAVKMRLLRSRQKAGLIAFETQSQYLVAGKLAS